MLGTVVMPGRLVSSFRFIDLKLSVSRSSRLDNRLLLVRRTDQQHRFVRAAFDAVESRPAPSRKAHNAKPFKTIQQTAVSIRFSRPQHLQASGIVKPT